MAILQKANFEYGHKHQADLTQPLLISSRQSGQPVRQPRGTVSLHLCSAEHRTWPWHFTNCLHVQVKQSNMMNWC